MRLSESRICETVSRNLYAKNGESIKSVTGGDTIQSDAYSFREAKNEKEIFG